MHACRQKERAGLLAGAGPRAHAHALSESDEDDDFMQPFKLEVKAQEQRELSNGPGERWPGMRSAQAGRGPCGLDCSVALGDSARRDHEGGKGLMVGQG